MSGPNPIAVARSIAGVLWRVRRPGWVEGSDVDTRVEHQELADVLAALAESGPAALTTVTGDLDSFLTSMSSIEPDRLERSAALAYWVNVYNAGALQLAARATEQGAETVLRVPGAFGTPFIRVGGEQLSLDGVEHGKVRRFGDPRVHGALVCGSVSCPTLRSSPYTPDVLDGQLDNQMRVFLAGGGAIRVGTELSLSRVFKWFGGDFTRPASMPTWIPAPKRQVLKVIAAYLPSELKAWMIEAEPKLRYQPYDWGLRCSVK